MNTITTKTKQIQQAINNNTILDKTQSAKTHVSKHTNLTNVKSMERMLQEVPANTAFYPEQDVNFLLEEAMFYKAQEIAEWLEYATPHEKKAFQVIFDPEDYNGMIGKGFMNNHKTNLIKEYESDTLNLVLQKDNYADLGFSLVTAYPSLDSPTIKPTMRNLKEVTTQTDMYQSADAVKKAYLLYRTSYQSQFSVSYKQGDYGPEGSAVFLHVPTSNPNTRHIIKIKESGMSLTTKTYDPITQTSKAIPTKYTQLRDKLFENPQKNLVVPLHNKTLRETFQKDFPEVVREIKYIHRNIQDNVPDARKKQLEKVSQPTHQPHVSREIPNLPYAQIQQEHCLEYSK